MTKELVDSQAQSTLTHSDSDDDDDGDEEVSTGRVAAEASSTRGGDEAAARAWLASDVTWKSGDKCRAIWSENHQYVSRNCFIMSACLYCTSTWQLVFYIHTHARLFNGPLSRTTRVRLYQKHTHPFNGLLSATTWVSQYQKGKTSLGFTEARDSEWQ